MSATVTALAIGKRIKQARETLSYNQADLAKVARITPAAICQIEAGARIPSTPVLARIASALQVSTDFLLGSTSEVEFKDLLQDKYLRAFFRSYQSLNSQDKSMIQKQVEFLKAQHGK